VSNEIEKPADRVAYYVARANEMRRIASETEFPETVVTLLALAAQWETLAEGATRASVPKN
jgi:hypothetical protein